MLCHGCKFYAIHIPIRNGFSTGVKRLINRALMPLSLASDLQLNPDAMAPDNSNMKVLLWNAEDAKALYNIS